MQAKSYSINSVDIRVQLNRDGSADVTETRTYNFDGSFSWADEWILLTARCRSCTNYQISNVVLKEGDREYVESLGRPGTYFITQTPDKFYIKWYYQAQNQQKTFTLSYTINNAITNHADISEFYWQLIGDEWSKGTGLVNAEVFLAEEAPDSQIWAFGHGPSNGKINIVSSNQVNFSARNLPARKFFEIRILFPRLVGAAHAQAGRETLKKILKEEEGFIKAKRYSKALGPL